MSSLPPLLPSVPSFTITPVPWDRHRDPDAHRFQLNYADSLVCVVLRAQRHRMQITLSFAPPEVTRSVAALMLVGRYPLNNFTRELVHPSDLRYVTSMSGPKPETSQLRAQYLPFFQEAVTYLSQSADWQFAICLGLAYFIAHYPKQYLFHQAEPSEPGDTHNPALAIVNLQAEPAPARAQLAIHLTPAIATRLLTHADKNVRILIAKTYTLSRLSR